MYFPGVGRVTAKKVHVLQKCSSDENEEKTPQ